MPEGHDISLENHQWDQSTPFNSEKFSNSTQVNQKVSGALRYFAFLGRRRYTLYRIAVQAIEGEGLELITYLVRNLVPPTEIIPYLPPYMCAENIAQITKELMGAFAKGQLRQTLSALEPRWSKFCEAETDAEALVQIFMQLSPAFPELLPENSELRSADFDRVILTSGYRAGCIPGFFPDGACISAQCLTLEADERVNRIPGEIGFTWDIDMISDPKLENPFTSDAIGKVYTYSNQYNTKYGYLLTDGSLLVFRRCEKEPGIPRNGHIEISKTFWVGYNANLALFYLHLLASDPTKWKLPSNLWNGSSRLFDIYDLETFIDQ